MYNLPYGEDAADVLRTGHRLAIEFRKVRQRCQPEPVKERNDNSILGQDNKLLIAYNHLNRVFFSLSGNFSSSWILLAQSESTWSASGNVFSDEISFAFSRAREIIFWHLSRGSLVLVEIKLGLNKRAVKNRVSPWVNENCCDHLGR